MFFIAWPRLRISTMAKESEIKGALIPKQQKNRYEIRFLFDSNDEDEENSKK